MSIACRLGAHDTYPQAPDYKWVHECRKCGKVVHHNIGFEVKDQFDMVLFYRRKCALCGMTMEEQYP